MGTFIETSTNVQAETNHELAQWPKVASSPRPPVVTTMIAGFGSCVADQCQGDAGSGIVMPCAYAFLGRLSASARSRQRGGLRLRVRSLSRHLSRR